MGSTSLKASVMTTVLVLLSCSCSTCTSWNN